MGTTSDVERGPKVLELQQTPEAAPRQPALPPKESTPDQVSAYLCQILQRRGYGPHQAKATAASWTKGTGVELREYTREVYMSIFGTEDGWILHEEVKAQVAIERAEFDLARRRKDYADEYAQRWNYRLSHHLYCSLLSSSLIGTTVMAFLTGLAILAAGIPMITIGNSHPVRNGGVAMVVIGTIVILIASCPLTVLVAHFRSKAVGPDDERIS